MSQQAEYETKYLSRRRTCEAETVNDLDPAHPFLQPCNIPYKRHSRKNKAIPFCESHLKRYVQIERCKNKPFTLNFVHQITLDALCETEPLTIYELAKRLFIPKQRAYLRVLKLRDLGLAVQCKQRWCTVSNQFVFTWRSA
jgi:hypothetical protein